MLYTILLAAIVASWTVPPYLLLSLHPVPRFLAAVAITFTPIFVANLVFAQRFETTDVPTAAFGINLLGAMVGGILEYASLIVEYRALALIVGVLYVAAYFAWRSGDSEMRPVPDLAART